MAYYYSPMKIKIEMFDSNYLGTNDDYTYRNWEKQLESSKWVQFCEQYAENYQFSLLRGMAVVGVSCSQWEDVFDNIYRERDVFEGLSKLFWEDNDSATWRFWGKKLALESKMLKYYPPYYPEWLLQYGYTHRQYINDIAVYWDNIHDDYYKPWPGERVGEDSPPIARLKKLGETARSEIDKVAQHANGRM